MRHYNFQSQIDKYTIEDCREYLDKYPNGLMADSVRARLASLEPVNGYSEQEIRDEDSFWENNKHSEEGIKKYMELFPNGKYITECENNLMELRRDRAGKIEESIKKIIKVLGFIVLGMLAITVIVGCIRTKKWPAFATLAPILYSMNRLYEW